MKGRICHQKKTGEETAKAKMVKEKRQIKKEREKKKWLNFYDNKNLR